jgi:hypothetical protein
MDISTRVWEILAADASVNVIYQGVLFIKNIIFTDYTADTDVFVVQDREGKTIARGNGAADLSPIDIHIGDTALPVNGLIVPTLTAGRLLIFIK